MSYRIKLSQPIDANLRRIVTERLSKAIDAIDARGEQAAHDVRKQLKKARAVLRLLRDAQPELYDKENAALRDAARMISDLRDTEAMVETFDALTDHFNDQIDRRHYTPIGQTLRERLEAAEQRAAEQGHAAQVRDELDAARTRVVGWPELPDDFDMLGRGVARSYKRGRNELKALIDHSDPSPETVHTLRKRAKYHRYHTRLLQDMWKPALKARRKELHRLTDQLGMHHDLHVLDQALSEEPEAFGQVERVEDLCIMARTRQEKLLDKAQRLGSKLFVDKPKRLAKRWETYWSSERPAHQPERTLDLTRVA